MTNSTVVCRCGNTGCLEAIAGGTAIAREGHAAALDGRSPPLAAQLDLGVAIAASHVGTAASRVDPYSAQLLSKCGGLVGETLATLITGVDPSLVVVGGGVAQAGGILLAAIRGWHLSSIAVRRYRGSPVGQIGARQDGRTPGRCPGGVGRSLRGAVSEDVDPTRLAPRTSLAGGDAGLRHEDQRAKTSSPSIGSEPTTGVPPANVVATGRSIWL